VRRSAGASRRTRGRTSASTATSSTRAACGRSVRSLRRALTLADGWDPFGLSLAQLEPLLARGRASRAWRERTAPFELVLSLEERLDPTDAGERARLADLLGRYRDLGATMMNLRFRHDGLAHYLAQLDVFAAELAPRFA